MGGGGLVPPAGQFILKKGVWTKIIEWGGVTVLPIEYTVTVQSEYRAYPIEWRRYGVAWVPYWQGEFKEQESFHIYPGDFYLRVDLWPVNFDVGITIERTTSEK